MTKEERNKLRKWLSQYKIFKKEVEERKKYLENFREEMYNSLSSVWLDRVGHTTTIQNQTAIKVEKIEKEYGEMLRSMERCICDLKKTMLQIEKCIDSLEGNEWVVLYHRFILCEEWENVADSIDYGLRQCKRIEIKALEKLWAKYSFLHKI